MAKTTAHDLFFQGTQQLSEGRLPEAEAAFRQALQLAPDLAEAHGNLGYLLDRQGHGAEAERHYRRAIELIPTQLQTGLNLGVLLADQKRFAEAERIYRQILAAHPDSPAAWSNLGVLLACMQSEPEAERCYRTALALDPGYAKAAFNLAYLLLRQGNYAEGWERLEARDWYRPFAATLACPRWQGEALTGKSLLIGIEAGHGDMIQFCRYAALAKAHGAARVSVLCHPGLKTLFASLRDADNIIALDESFAPDDWDYWVPPLSLPFHFGTRLTSIPADLPYLAADPERLRHWAAILGAPAGRLRVGLAWKGNPRFENDADRSLPGLDTLAPLGTLPDIDFFSLQKGCGEDEASHSQAFPALVNMGPGIGDFADTAAIIMQLDLVIAVDTAVAHLAGALGKPCWVLLPYYKADWRWLKERDDSPWYPGRMRLFRQAVMGAWPAVVARLRAGLQAWQAT